MGEREALQVLSNRAASVRSMSSQAMLQLSRPDGQTVRFDAAVVMKPPDRVRMRAWKFSQAVFDLTLTPDGLWLVAPRDDKHKDQVMSASVSAGEFARAWSLFSGGIFDDPGIVAANQGDELVITRHTTDEPTIVCVIDRATLTPRRYEMRDEAKQTRFTLKLDGYANVAGIPWPMRLSADGPSGRVLLELHDVELNDELSPEAFVPPKRAERLP
jgi:outer membrane lipoprotein-sorting protein